MTSFAHAEFATKKKTTRRETFLARMDELIPWTQLIAVIEPFYPKGERGRPPIKLERMLRVCNNPSELWAAMTELPFVERMAKAKLIRFELPPVVPHKR